MTATAQAPTLTADRHELLIKQYEIFIGLFKTYCDLVIKLVSWHFAISGAILAYYLKNGANNCHLIPVILLPIVVSALLALFFFFGARKANEMHKAVEKLREDLELESGPHLEILTLGLKGTAAVLSVVGVVLSIFMRYEWIAHGGMHC